MIQTEQILEKCKCLVTQQDYRAAYLQEIQSKVLGISGCFSNYIPVEIISAAGFHPLRIIGRYETSSFHGKSLYNPVCSFARDIFTAAESGAFSFVSNMIFPNSCDSLRVLQQMWETNPTLPPVYVLLHPIQADDNSVRYFARQTEKLADFLQNESGQGFTDSQLADSIKRYNQTRQLLGKLYAGHDDESPFLKGSERITLVTAGMIMNRDEYNQILQEILDHDYSSSSEEVEIGKRIMVIGPLVDNLELLEMIEQLGALIVADDVTNGSRYFNMDVELEGNLYENLAKRYLRSGPSPTMNADILKDERLFRRRVTDLHPDGVIFINQKFCEPHVHSYLARLEILKEMKINALMLEVEHDRDTVSERDLFRIESFVEMLGED
jgi:benzoyl-CoA reductase subunit C